MLNNVASSTSGGYSSVAAQFLIQLVWNFLQGDPDCSLTKWFQTCLCMFWYIRLLWICARNGVGKRCFCGITETKMHSRDGSKIIKQCDKSGPNFWHFSGIAVKWLQGLSVQEAERRKTSWLLPPLVCRWQGTDSLFALSRQFKLVSQAKVKRFQCSMGCQKTSFLLDQWKSKM